MSGNFTSIDHSQMIGVDHFFPTDSGLFISKYSLEEDSFSNVTIILHKELGTKISFQTSDSKYFDNPELYFGNTSEELIKKTYEIEGRKINRSRKDLGDFRQFGKLVTVTIYKSTAYGYSISLTIK